MILALRGLVEIFVSNKKQSTLLILLYPNEKTKNKYVVAIRQIRNQTQTKNCYILRSRKKRFQTDKKNSVYTNRYRMCAEYRLQTLHCTH